MDIENIVHSLACVQTAAKHQVFRAQKREERTGVGNKIGLTISEQTKWVVVLILNARICTAGTVD